MDLHPSGKVMMVVQYFLEGGDAGKGKNAFSTFVLVYHTMLLVSTPRNFSVFNKKKIFADVMLTMTSAFKFIISAFKL